MSLATYRSKRNFSATAEPKGNKAATRTATPPGASPDSPSRVLFVIQKHAASHLHYDFRLELEGVLKSWAVPKGFPTVKGEKHLAVEVEDHPVEYANFEGIIPAGHYGGGTVMLWDAGVAEITEPRASLKRGKLDLSLQGQKLKGHWALVRIRARSATEKTPWLLIKTEADLKPISARADDRSVQSGRRMNQIALVAENTWQSNRGAAQPSAKKPSRAPSKSIRRKPSALSRARR